MKASELIPLIQQAIEEYGDLEIWCEGEAFINRITAEVYRDHVPNQYPKARLVISSGGTT